MIDKIRRRILYVINFVLFGLLRFGNFIDVEMLDGSMLLIVLFVCGFVILFIIIIYLFFFVVDDFLNIDFIWEFLVLLMVIGIFVMVVFLVGIVFGCLYDVI